LTEVKDLVGKLLPKQNSRRRPSEQQDDSTFTGSSLAISGVVIQQRTNSWILPEVWISPNIIMILKRGKSPTYVDSLGPLVHYHPWEKS